MKVKFSFDNIVQEIMMHKQRFFRQPSGLWGGVQNIFLLQLIAGSQ